MSLSLNLLYLMLLPWAIGSPQINLHLTDWISESVSDVVMQHNCLNVVASIEKENDPRQVISYCLSEWPSKWNINGITHYRVFTFAELHKHRITSQHLYLWSAPIDVAERYQFYLDQLCISNDTSLGTQRFFNCTLPSFGPMCQYSFDFYQSDYSSLNEMIYDFYLNNKYEPITLTCYTHLQCNRGPAPSCLDWSEICDGKVDCLDGGHDEEHCWQLEMNDCAENEYRCINGQCIPDQFFRDNPAAFECLDGADEARKFDDKRAKCSLSEPTFMCEDVACVFNIQFYASPLTSSCVKQRTDLLLQAMFLNKPTFISDECWFTFMCALQMPHSWTNSNYSCTTLCERGNCNEPIKNYCPNMIFVPAEPVLFGDVYFAYAKKGRTHTTRAPSMPTHVCYTGEFCKEFFPNRSSVSFNNATCMLPNDLRLAFIPGRAPWMHLYVKPTYEQLWTCNAMIRNDSPLCNRSNMYQCRNSSKCISIYRLNDGVRDCHYNDDEQLTMVNNTCELDSLKNYFKCTKDNRCISRHLVGNRVCDCIEYLAGLCEDEHSDSDLSRKKISFQTIGDGFTKLLPILIDGQNQTDETECEQWLCNNTYTRCNGLWNCLDGADEVDCDRSPIINCPLYHHICISLNNTQFMCLSIEKANNGQIDCLGGTDEPKSCRSNDHIPSKNYFYCEQENKGICLSTMYLCQTGEQCTFGDDEKLCDKKQNRTNSFNTCSTAKELVVLDMEQFICNRLRELKKPKIVHFSFGKYQNMVVHTEKDSQVTFLSSYLINRNIRQHHHRCHRGIDVRVRLNSEKNLSTTSCLCPPSFYGNMCQYQNQRVSLTVQFRALSDAWRTPFTILISLIDDSHDRIIHSYKQLTYLPMRDCQTKFNVYLLYSTRPKNQSKLYSRGNIPKCHIAFEFGLYA
ncbi:unnamed protein product [Rotaria sp. Silwood2]|nr:unnamed protein product [Rotaria sp. Silwood2]